MNLHRSFTSLSAVAISLCAATSVHASGANRGSLRGQHQQQHDGASRRHLEQEDDTNLQFDEIATPLCRSIIAVGGIRLPDDDIDNDGNAVLSLEDEFADLHVDEDFFNMGHDGLIAPPLPVGAPVDDDETSDRGVISYHEDIIWERRVYRIPYEGNLAANNSDEEFVCELDDGSTLPIQGTHEQLLELRTMLNKGELISAQSSVVTEGIGRIDSIITILEDMGEGIESIEKQTEIVEEYVLLPPGAINLLNNYVDNGTDNGQRRRLNQYEGPKNILIVKVTDKDGLAVAENAAYISDKFFGTGTDTITMTSGFQDCSFGKLIMTPAVHNELAAPGVLELDIDIKLSESTQATLRTAYKQATKEKLGIDDLSAEFDHVVYVVAACFTVGNSRCGWAAYAYVNHWMSVFQGRNYKLAAVQMHELGHNLNFAHSGGKNGMTYSDHTCLMGNPLWGDDLGKMCFNPSKNFQIAKGGDSWYDDQHVRVWNSGITGGTSWKGRLISVAEYNNNEANDLIVLKLETGGGSDYFIGFNRKVGPNSQVVDFPNEVTVHQVDGNDGLGYSTSYLKGNLVQMESMVIENWRNSNMDLVIYASKIDYNSSPGYADLVIEFGPQTDQPTDSPTAPPPTTSPTITSSPSKSPSKYPTTNPTIPPPTSSPTHSPTSSPSNTPSKSPTTSPTHSPTSSPSNTPIKSPTTSPIDEPCGNGVCEANENPLLCPSDCISVTFKTKSAADSNTGGQMFTVEASNDRDIVITSFDIEGKKDGEGEVKVYTRLGDYEGHEQNDSEWDMIYNEKIKIEKKAHTNLGALIRNVTVPAGTVQSFYVYSTKGMLYKRGNGNRSAFDGDGSLTIIEGAGTKKLFEDMTGNGQFSGGISYYTSGTGTLPQDPDDDGCGNSVCDGGENPVTCPSDCVAKSFNTQSNANADSGGAMFTIEANGKDISIESFDIIGKKSANAQVMVYTREGNYQGHEESDSGWELLLDDNVQMEKNVPTSVGPLIRDVKIDAGSHQAFYIWSKKGLLYTHQWEVAEGTPFGGHEALIITVGAATKKLFQQVTSGAEFSGGISYYESF